MPKVSKERNRHIGSPYYSLDHEKKRIENMINNLLDSTHPNWKGEPTALTEGRSVFGTHEELRMEVNKIGRIHGCHECLTILKNDTDQPWIGDHIPPTNLIQSVRDHHNLPDQTRLLPSCERCSSLQAALVKRLNAGDALTEEERNLIFGGTTTRPIIRSSNSRVNKTQGLQIQCNGTINGCHVCGTKIPRDRYIADHCPPQEFLTSWMPQLCEKLDIELPEPTARPHCARCSSAQGGSMSQFIRDAKQLANKLGITVYS
jgi:hypothetical protein